MGMISDYNSGQKLSFKAFLSHAYDAEQLNIEFFQMFNEVADVQFEVDIGLKNLNVTRLEHRVRDCDAFVGVYPFPGEPSSDPLSGDTLKASRYFRLEMELAARAGRPSIIFYDKRWQSAIQSLGGFSEHVFTASEVHGTMSTRFRSKIKAAFKEFCDRLKAEIEGRAAGFEGRRERRQVGLLVPRGKGGYPKRAIRAIEDVAREFGHAKLADLGWPPVADACFFDQLDSLDWIFVDVGAQTAATGMLGVIHSRFIPAVRMHRSAAPPEPEDWAGTAGVGRLFGALDVGYRKDIVYWRGSVDSLYTQLLSRVRVAQMPPKGHEVVKTLQEALKYFRLASRKLRIFISYAGDDRDTAEKLVALIRGHFPTVFDYRDRGESLPPGSQWREEIKKEILGAQFGVLLLSQAYKCSGYCDWEKNLLVDAHLDKGMPLLPVLLEGRARDMPTGLESLQPERFHEGDTPETVALRLVRRMEKLPVKGARYP